MKHRLFAVVPVIISVGVVLTACAATPAASPTSINPAAAPVKTSEPAKAAATQPTAVAPARATFPEKGKAITLIVAWATGSGSDIAARVLAPLMERELATSIEIVNKPGAGGQVGLSDLSQAKADGYTVSVITVPTMITTYLDPQRKAAFTRKSFDSVAGYVADPYAMVVKSDGPYKSLKDLMDAAKASPGTIKVSLAGGKLSATHLSALLLEKAAGVKFAKVFFEGVGPALTALLGGHVDVTIGSAGGYTSQIKNNEVRMLGLTDKEESPLFPGVKTLESQGYPISFAANMGLIVPAGTPKEAVTAIQNSVKKAMESGELKAKMNAAGSVTRYSDAAAFGTLWSDLEAQIKPFMTLADE